MTDLLNALRYDRWKAPAEDERTLIWPAPSDLLRQTIENQKALSGADAVKIQGIALSEVRQHMRQWLGCGEEHGPLIATGHQTELHHPGVWAKNAMINAVAARLGGRAIHFAVDTDAPKHLRLRWPGGSAPLSDEESPTAAWSGLVPTPSAGHVQAVQSAFDAAASSWRFKSLVDAFLESMQRLSLEASSISAALANALHELDWSMGLRHDTLLVSPLCLSEPYLAFVHHVLSRADEFAADYNASLDEFRRENKIAAPGRPMPNLSTSADTCEVPFWLDDVTSGARQRAAVSRRNGQFALQLSDGQAFTFNPGADGWTAAGELMLFLRRNGHRLSPRALTLTTVLRLLAADQFVHGIGGGQYDQVLDKLIVRHWKMAPPRFSVTTATLYFPEAAGRTRACLPCLAADDHRARHGVLGEAKRELVEAIASAPRGSIERAVQFTQLHEKLRLARRHEPFLSWERHLGEALAREQSEKALFDREFFYAIQPVERLNAMIDRYRTAFSE